eukprot:3664028-Ditylum_brightwellii.AAC.1
MLSSVRAQKTRSPQLFLSSLDYSSNFSNEKHPSAWRGRGPKKGKQGVVYDPLSVTKIIRQIRNDEPNGGHPQLN